MTLNGLFGFDSERGDYFWEGFSTSGQAGKVYQSEWQAVETVSQQLEPWSQDANLMTTNAVIMRSNPETTASQIISLARSANVIATGYFYFDSQSAQWWWQVIYNQLAGWVPQSSLRQP